MNAIIYRVSLDMLATLSQVTIKAKKGDSACKIHITLTKNGKIYKISEGCHATFNAKKSDGNFIYNRCTIEGDTIVYDFSSSIDEDGICQVSACEGNVECEVTLYDANGKQLTSSRFILFIDGTVYNGEEIVSSPQTDAFKELINDIETKLENGEFVGKPGEKGDKGEKGEDGKDYVLSEEDKKEIAGNIKVTASNNFNPNSTEPISGVGLGTVIREVKTNNLLDESKIVNGQRAVPIAGAKPNLASSTFFGCGEFSVEGLQNFTIYLDIVASSINLYDTFFLNSEGNVISIPWTQGAISFDKNNPQTFEVPDGAAKFGFSIYRYQYVVSGGYKIMANAGTNPLPYEKYSVIGYSIPKLVSNEYEKYFDITEDGVISLKSAYRGALNFKYNPEGVPALDTGVKVTNVPDALSDNGEAKAGSKNHELPSEICIPLTINGITVKSLAAGMFAYNDRIKRVVLNQNIKKLNGYTFARARNLAELECTEQITQIGNSEFLYSPIKKVEFPNLTGALPQSVFKLCPLLEYVDIGSVESIGKTAFQFATNLSEIKIKNFVKTVGDGAFNYCLNLRTIDNIISPGVTTEIGIGAFSICRPTYNWQSLKNAGCTVKEYATPYLDNLVIATDKDGKQRHTSKFWEGVSFTPCENRAISFLSQMDLRWKDVWVRPERADGTLGGLGCAAFSVMGAWCSLNNVTVDDARDYIDICKKYGTDIKYVTGTYAPNSTVSESELNAFFDAMGLSRTYLQNENFDADSVAEIYQAIADGKYVIFTTGSYSAATGHAVCVTGITPLGELIVQDSATNGAWQLGIRDNFTGKIPMQNLIVTNGFNQKMQCMILGKKAVT